MVTDGLVFGRARSGAAALCERNPRARAFYTKSGFLDVGAKLFIVGSDPQIDRVMMRPIDNSSSV
jgi:hypothetical protein